MITLGTNKPQTGPGARPGWTTTRIVSTVIGLLLALGSVGLLGAGRVSLWASTTQRRRHHPGHLEVPSGCTSPARPRSRSGGHTSQPNGSLG